MEYLDKQMYIWKDKLNTDVKIPIDSCFCLATTIKNEIEGLNNEERNIIIDSNPVKILYRIEELQAFQTMMDTFYQLKREPALIRSQIIVQNYICFVYLKDSLFELLKKSMSSKSITKLCCKFLLNNPVRAFRNSFAHGNWNYKKDFSGIDFWAYKGEPTEEPMDKWEVCQEDLSFWQALSRVIAYVTYLTLDNYKL